MEFEIFLSDGRYFSYAVRSAIEEHLYFPRPCYIASSNLDRGRVRTVLANKNSPWFFEQFQ